MEKQSERNFEQQEQSVDRQPIWRTKRCWVITALVLLGVLLFVVVPTTVVVSKRKDSTAWSSKQINSDLDNTTFLKLGGTWSDRLLVVGNKGSKFQVEDHKYNEDDTVEQVSTFAVDGVVVAVGVNELVSRVVLALDAPLRFNVYDRDDGDSWTQSGTTIALSDIPNARADGHSPTIMLSDDGTILSLAIQGSNAGVFTFEEATAPSDGIIGGKWSQRGEPLFDNHEGMYGSFATFASISGDAQILAVASEFQRLSLHRYIGGRWANFAEYDESPRSDLGSLSLSGDGSTVAVGSFDGARRGIGQLHIFNAVWPWYLDEGRESSFDLEKVNLQVVLSRWGTTVLFGRFPLDGRQASLEVFDYKQLENKWQSRGGPFGMVDSTSPGLVDLSTDGYRAAAVIDGKVTLFEYQHL